jgi:phosphatidylinositol glycan class H protein
MQLQIVSPADNVTQFTVSTRKERGLLFSVILSALTFTLRAMTVATMVLTALTRLFFHRFMINHRMLPYVIVYLSQLPWTYIIPLYAIGTCGVLFRGYEEESFLVIKGLGVQVTSSSRFYFGSTSKFFPTSTVKDIVINEAFLGFQVRFYLALIVENSPTLVVVFPRLLPRRPIVEKVYRKSRECLYR